MTENLLNDKVARLIGSATGALRFAVVRTERDWMGLVALVDNRFIAKRVALASWDDALPQNDVIVYELKSGTVSKWWALLGRACHAGDGSPEWREDGKKPSRTESA